MDKVALLVEVERQHEKITRLLKEQDELKAQNQRLRAALIEAMTWNWLDDEGIITEDMLVCSQVANETPA